jgi:hypothetical protein
VLRVAYAVAKESLPEYAHRFSPKKFTQHQLFACLVLKTFMRRDYRGIVAMLADTPDLCAAIDLHHVPHFTTLQKAADRLLRGAKVHRLLQRTVMKAMRRKHVRTAAADSSGFDRTHASRYYVWRTKQRGLPAKHMTYRRYPKLGVICDTTSHVILSVFATRGPTPDVHQLDNLMDNLVPHVTLWRLIADAGFDSEANHELLRDFHGIRSIIPAGAGRPTKDNKLPSGRYRRLMRRRFDRKTYNQRSQVETVMSMLKRNLDGCIRARMYWSQCRELTLKALTHNILIAYWIWRFSTEPF